MQVTGLPAFLVPRRAGEGGGVPGMWVVERPRWCYLAQVALVILATQIAPPGGISRVGAAEDRGLTIMEEQRRINGGYRDELVLYRMILVNAKGDRSVRSLELRTLEGPETGDKTLLIFKDPPDVRGTTLLTHENRA